VRECQVWSNPETCPWIREYKKRGKKWKRDRKSFTLKERGAPLRNVQEQKKTSAIFTTQGKRQFRYRQPEPDCRHVSYEHSSSRRRCWLLSPIVTTPTITHGPLCNNASEANIIQGNLNLKAVVEREKGVVQTFVIQLLILG
jgi:hypothetical protein